MSVQSESKAGGKPTQTSGIGAEGVERGDRITQNAHFPDPIDAHSIIEGGEGEEGACGYVLVSDCKKTPDESHPFNDPYQS